MKKFIFLSQCFLVCFIFLQTEVKADNQLPSVYVTSKHNEISYTAPAVIELNAIAYDADGSVAKVEYFLCSTKLAEVTESPYVIIVKELPPGYYTFTAKATDNQGGVSESCFSAVIIDPDSCGDIVPDFEHTNVCQNQNVSFWSTSIGDPYPNSFEWKVNGVTVSSGSSMNYTFGSATSYTVQLKTGYNQLCATETKTIVVNDIAGPIMGLVKVCSYQQDVPYSIPAVEDATYTWWVNGDATISGNGTNTVSVDFGQNFTEIHVGVNVEDCYKESVLSLEQSVSCGSNPTSCSVQSAFGHSLPCLNQNTSFWDLSTGAHNTFEWKVNGVQVSTYNHLQYTFPADGTYVVELGVGSGGNICSTSSQTLLMPQTAGPVTGPSSVCLDHQYVFSVDPVPGVSYNWWLNGDGSIVSGQGTHIVTAYIGNYFAGGDLKVGVQFGSCYRESGKTLEVNCGAKKSAAIIAAPHPFPDQTKIMLENKEKIRSVKIFSSTGKELYYSSKVDSESVLIGETIPAGCYIIQVITETGSYFKTMIKY